jgi:hypothetical protein
MKSRVRSKRFFPAYFVRGSSSAYFVRGSLLGFLQSIYLSFSFGLSLVFGLSFALSFAGKSLRKGR